MKKVFRHSDGNVLEVIVGNANLSLKLATGSIERVLGERTLHQAVQFVSHKSATTCPVLGIAAIINRPHACIRIGRIIALDGIDKTVALTKSQVQTAAHGWSAKHVAEEIKMKMPWVIAAESLCSDHHMSLMCIFLAGDVKNIACVVGKLHVCRCQITRVSLPNFTCYVFLHNTEHLLGLHVSQDIKHHPFGMIKALGKTLHIVGTELPECFGIAQDVATKRMTWEKKALELIENKFRRLVPIALYLVDDNLRFASHLFLRIGTVQGYVEKKVDGARHVLSHASAIIDRLLFARESIEFSTHTFHCRNDLSSRATLRSLERHMLGEMGHSALRRQFVTCPGINCDTEINHICLSWSTDNTQALGKSVSRKHKLKEGGKPVAPRLPTTYLNFCISS